jgi:RsiW-degrading membrane proteinase PrsW (M82 family)
MKLLYEAIIVGIVTAVVGFVIATGMMYIGVEKFSFKKYHFWKRVLLGYFLTGVVIHLLFEALGANKWYCKNGNACKY